MKIEPQNIVNQIYYDMWNGRNFDLIDGLIAHDFCLYGPKKSLKGRNQYKAAAQAWLKKLAQVLLLA